MLLSFASTFGLFASCPPLDPRRRFRSAARALDIPLLNRLSLNDVLNELLDVGAVVSLVCDIDATLDNFDNRARIKFNSLFKMALWVMAYFLTKDCSLCDDDCVPFKLLLVVEIILVDCAVVSGCQESSHSLRFFLILSE